MAIWDYTRDRWSERQAEAYVNLLRSGLQRLMESPGMGRLHSDFDPPVRVHPIRQHLIVYRVESDTLDVLMIPSARQDWRSFLNAPDTP